MLEICGVSERQMPKLFESFAVVGRLTKEAAQTLGLPETVKVVDRKSTRLNSSHSDRSRMPSSA